MISTSCNNPLANQSEFQNTFDPGLNIATTTTSTTTSSPSSSSPSTSPPSSFTPSDISGIQLWVDAQDATSYTNTAGALTALTDKSGKGVTLTPVNSPTISTNANLGGKTVFRFNGTSQYVQTNLDIGEDVFANLSVIIVTKQTAQAGGPWGGDDGGWDRFLLDDTQNGLTSTTTDGSAKQQGTWNSTTANIIVTEFQEDVVSGSNLYFNGSAQYGAGFTANHGPQTDAFLQIASIGGSPGVTKRLFVGDIGEVIIYDSVLSTTDRQKLEGYLACRWSLQASLPAGHPYQSDCP